MSSGVARDFIVVSPANPTGPLPIIFFWHWLGGSADDFLSTGDLANAVEQQQFIAVIPESIPATVGGQDLKWPYDMTQTQQRMDQEFRFFDDMLSCVSQQFTVNKNCVSTAGVSAGALWSGQLGPARSQYLSSFVSLSGGVGGIIKPWSGAGQHKLPGIVLWGGPTDNCFNLLNFEMTSNALEDALTADGHFFIECIHNCGHGPPPVDVAPGASAFSPVWDFVFAHPFWLNAGESPWSGGLPAGFIPWCGIGKGSAIPRTDPTCGSPGC
jgi:predicted esterase